MATKAALMGDIEMFNEIAKADDPKSCKALGRGVRNFDEALWNAHLEDVAFEVVRQKFEAEKSLRLVLLSTGNKILAEAAPNDRIWGIGLRSDDGRIQDPTQWLGRNVLGNALMRTREHLQGNTNSVANCTQSLMLQSASVSKAAPKALSKAASKTAHADVRVADSTVVREAEWSLDAADEATCETVEAAEEATCEAVCSALPKTSSLQQPEEECGCAAIEPAVHTVQLPVMSDSEGEPLLLYCDANGTEATRLSAAPLPLRLIFLDVDGVLNNKAYTQAVYSSECSSSADILLPECLTQLRSALVGTGACVVLSSTWRSDPELRSVIVEALEDMRPGCVVGQTPQDPSFRNDMRPAEIARFLEEPTVAEVMRRSSGCWCAVDDMNLLKQAEALQQNIPAVRRLLPVLRHSFVRTIKEVGLDEEGTKSIQQVLDAAILDVAVQGPAYEDPGTQSRKKRGKR